MESRAARLVSQGASLVTKSGITARCAGADCVLKEPPSRAATGRRKTPRPSDKLFAVGSKLNQLDRFRREMDTRIATVNAAKANNCRSCVYRPKRATLVTPRDSSCSDFSGERSIHGQSIGLAERPALADRLRTRCVQRSFPSRSSAEPWS